MEERNPLRCCSEAAFLARLLLHEASRGQIFQDLLVERFVIPAMKASSAEPGKAEIL